MIEKDKIIVLLALGCIFASITAFSVGFGLGFGVAKSVQIRVGIYD